MSVEPQPTPRAYAAKTICDQLRALGKYYVKRGSLNLASFDFDAHPKVAYLMLMGADLDTNREIQPFVSAQAQLVIATTMADAAQEEQLELDDAVLDEFAIDATYALKQAGSAQYPTGDEYVVDLPLSNATMREFHNAGFQIQGVVVEFRMQF